MTGTAHNILEHLLSLTHIERIYNFIFTQENAVTQQKTGFGIFTQCGFSYCKVSNRRGGGGGRIIGWVRKNTKN